MKAEIRADGLHVSGYVNVPGRASRPIFTKRGKVIEIIEQRAFQKAIDRAQSIQLLLDHRKDKVLASTKDKTLAVREDEVGLRAEATVTDQETIAAAKAGRLKGWSFNMLNPVDELEERADQLPIRRVKDFDMTEITLALDRIPAYSSSTIELRADEEVETEARAMETEVILSEVESEEVDNSVYRNRAYKARI
ncbi:HK97 family phage prohead protease [Ihubacter massiliensis]|uniref:HK97 family phage prohead protease n=1 Tax=Ihubacter massiliensis TaxID=1852367 RepID=UPI002096E319|nr:HK97 family phage prohead protease [Ihubacter massiliensis]MCI7301314.1 HK97 family phage prohead protease [Clostridia bacterium]MCO7120586.1 HK97 family phage prohead protease [Ihubacter massiliensis]MDY3010606.1 HK97 family phage prohead protease [Clostridiales Family XIII bacterium]